LTLVTLADWLLALGSTCGGREAGPEGADLLQMGGRWQPWPGFAFGPLAETVVRIGTPGEADRQVNASEQ
jgi:hypothetical protein